MATPLDALARCLTLRTLLDVMTRRFGGYEIVARWTQGEDHHDSVVLLPASAKLDLPGRVLVVATTREGDIKEVICFAEVPARNALWHYRWPESPEFSGEQLEQRPRPPARLPVLARATSAAWEREVPPTQRSR